MAFPWPPGTNPRPDTQDSEVIICERGAVETAHERRLDPFRLPSISQWKNNLTALSQHHNLFFVTSIDYIYVYRPQGPFLGAKPKLILKPDLALPDAPNHLSHHPPNDINHIITGDLGDDEILLWSADSGNLGAYNVASIALAIDSLEAKDGEICDPWHAGSTVHCFFVQFNHCSTWGLAIHKHARLIAATANNRKITVFAFALQQNDNSHALLEELRAMNIGEDLRSWSWIDEDDKLARLRSLSHEERRSLDLRLRYEGHTNNIPSVSFLNSDLDPNADIMVSVDIDHNVIIWRVWESVKPLRMIEFKLASPAKYTSFNRTPDDDAHQRGWSIMALDPRSFRTKTLLNFACPGGQYPYTYSELANPAQPPYGQFPAANVQAFLPREVDIILGRRNDEPPENHRDPNEENRLLWLKPLDLPAPFLQTNVPVGRDENGFEYISVSPDEPDYDYSDRRSNSQSSIIDWTLNYRTDANYRNYLAQFSHARYCPSFAEMPFTKQTLAKVRWETEFELPPSIVKFPIMITSEQEVRLLRGPMSIQPTTIYEHPFYSQYDVTPRLSDKWERINLCQQIPELGIIIAASQRGRVGIFSMTEVAGQGPTLRLDHIIPKRMERIWGPLLGIAAGPVASQLDHPDEEKAHVPGAANWNSWRNIRHPTRRYRLMLYYMDQTVLHYDLFYKMPEDMRGVASDLGPDTSRWLYVKDTDPLPRGHA